LKASAFRLRDVDEQFLDTVFNHGISRHGQRYLITLPSLQQFQGPQPGQTCIAATLDPSLELVLELVRRLEYGGSRSRLTSFYGCEKTDDVRKFAVVHVGAPIYEFHVTDYEVHDMTFLKLGRTITESWINARLYWEGKMSDDPLRECLVDLPVKIGKQVGTI
jgi:hypothetical protein